ncbi:tRNA 4-thiouridine(8) synthase ThiI [Erysipelotrichaceae bacterium Oil+RF-744-GAM-WT-6]|jgi:thiamine biosynthesis protein ThiI|uniref:Probable tRNA sulfurtransferase n=1 Tax=Stecheria intestinalis TaxID=2606630 RepID=A0A7X2NPZ7_9FIRM|nr:MULTISPECIES: tRNA uracil 4-sulfurtransferase ThiI [Erysipelotrichaceae]MCI2153853.1 tRNA 4-thiouridine(8) synthase ThiI [Solobacterium sp.]MDY3234360.1 tRNA uracil 4-sulfurtransferase ThiI [Erysipelotrichaceae bacterium]MDY4680693.1 tRNA uracil 4-sulfurtransferase ThiI [Lachnospiraceae bacterium]MCI6746305.1 tRNA 4-thiouridine(8) synthase ThiI [Anaerolactibacter massiliensis]MDD5880737.1 tRNA 4-thiouridine(8) synthase ThiI [Stecheria intestinalis]
MVNYDTVLIRYGELSTKGKNRKDFIRKLDQNIRHMLKDFPALTYQRTFDRIYIRLNGEDPEKIRELLSKVSGISSFSFTEKVPSDLNAIEEACLRIASESGKHTFKIITKRHDKTFPLNSDGINRAVAGEILKATDLKVDVHEPELEIRIEVHSDFTYLTSEKIPGAGGYPAGINGKVLLMLSGGIDSPVAAYELMKRGLDVEAVHFASPPYTSENARQKVLDLAGMVSVYNQLRMRVHIVEFTDLQLEIYKAAGDPYAVTLMRRMMFRIAEQIAREEGCLALATGESVGQVASQTLESIACINEVISMPVLRPLICVDKVDIIDLARKIGTYETSILPYEDCCTIFDPKNPVTKPTSKKASFYESRFDYASMVEECVKNRTEITVHPAEAEDYL